MSNKKRISKFKKNKLRSDFLRKYSVKVRQKHVSGFDFALNFITEALERSQVMMQMSQPRSN